MKIRGLIKNNFYKDISCNNYILQYKGRIKIFHRIYHQFVDLNGHRRALDYKTVNVYIDILSPQEITKIMTKAL